MCMRGTKGLFSSRIRRTGGENAVHEDVMGNTRYYTKANGQSFAELTYDAQGMPESPNKLLNNDYGNYVFAAFTDHIHDTTYPSMQNLILNNYKLTCCANSL
jgi:hypothetical protein